MLEEPPHQCPFCGFEPDVPKADVKTAPELAVHRVYLHVGMEHPDRADELPPHLDA